MRYPFDGSYRVTQKYNKKNAAIVGGTHTGIDYALPLGTPVLAVDDAVVAKRGYNPISGYYVHLQDGATIYKYNHLSKRLCKTGESVKKGERVGLSGKSGTTTGPHLHFQMEIRGIPVDPTLYFDKPKSTSIDVKDADEKVDNKPKPEKKSTDRTSYIIKKGDTFWDLENAWRLRHGVLQRLNPKLNPRLLRVGQRIRRS
jgi:murein DD-endopeptidase MepM/ murein hydrolase activator NlpD